MYGGQAKHLLSVCTDVEVTHDQMFHLSLQRYKHRYTKMPLSSASSYMCQERLNGN